jgi:glucan-binding YG repeat protein
VAAAGPLIPIGLLNRLWYYLIFVISQTVGVYFLVVSGWYWVSTNSGQMGTGSGQFGNGLLMRNC